MLLELNQFVEGKRQPSYLLDRNLQVTRIPGLAPECGSISQISLPPGPAAKIIPSEMPNFILRGRKFATTTVSIPIISSGL